MLEAAGLHDLVAEVAREGLAIGPQARPGRDYGAVLASNVAEPLLALGRSGKRKPRSSSARRGSSRPG